ncbi:MAG: cell division protein FtsL [Gammaproteobacteria bacterium]|nr:cell division protein FtsL [Gammaproteobacteria bacterium]
MILTLAITSFISALGVIYSKHQSRKRFVELTELQQHRDELNTHWGRLQLEQSTWATHGRIEKIARTKLQMVIPDNSKVVRLSP